MVLTSLPIIVISISDERNNTNLISNHHNNREVIYRYDGGLSHPRSSVSIIIYCVDIKKEVLF